MTEGTDETSLQIGDLASIFWRQRWIIVASVLIGILLAVIYLHAATYQHTISLKVTPAGNSRPSLPGGLGGLASLAGVNLPSDSSQTSFELYLQGYYSREVADKLARDQNLMTGIFPKEWDSAGQEWEEPRSIVRTVTQPIKGLLGIPVRAWSPPTGARLQEFLDKNINVNRSRDSDIVTVSIDMEDPQLGSRLLFKLHKTIDEVLRQRSLNRSAEYIDYLSRKIRTVTVDEYRQALVQSLAEQEKMRMMASSSLSFSAEPFGTPSASILPTKPNPPLVLLVGFLIGSLIGCAIAFFRDNRNHLLVGQ